MVNPNQNWGPSINACARSTSYEHYLHLMAEAQAEALAAADEQALWCEGASQDPTLWCEEERDDHA